MKLALSRLQRNRRVIVLFVVMVLVPTATFSVLTLRAVRSDRIAAAQQKAELQRQIAQIVQADLNSWLLSTGADSGLAKAALRFEVVGDRVVFRDFQMSLPIAAAARPQPIDATPSAGGPTAGSLVDSYYPRIVVFLRDVKSRAQYFQRLQAVIVRLPDDRSGYVLPVDEIAVRVNQRLAQLSTATSLHPTFAIADVRNNRLPAGGSVVALDDYPFFQVIFAGGTNEAGATGGNWFLYAMTLLVAFTILGSVFLYRAVSQEARLSQLRTDFVSAVSHEFRSPLSSIMALSERLASARVDNPERVAEYHRVIGQDARRLSALVTRLLDFAQVENGGRAYSLERVDLVSVARDAIDACHGSLPRHDIQLFGEDAAPLWVEADRVALQHCIQNLLENAMKYSPFTQPIRVTCADVNGSNVVDVSDRGIGIPKSEQARIFEKFYRGAEASALEVTGVGIGLSLVAHVMKSHRGSVDVESQPGHGSRFRLSLPKADAL
jgi:signal transduction histidine kinase